ncbi:MAG: 50S ribosomal protein L25/general stress protein Ctc [Flavobacteriaceae bacterium]|nr:50S ribosomal protein L25/general stress protein Ctc [Flavobacteriaceae bacterium]MDA8758048.1 50S ribosomal protein L25/general stress protein Ctc [Flavobacteriaceae bacterium]MDB2314428.1 50S ribosomal protein L25/general stress protein Ctc [Flavobacteriaceae bacterium]
MKSITIKGSKRESVGKVATKALRNADKVPCVLYGGESPLHFSANELDFSKLVYTPNAHTVVLDINGDQKINAILQDIQFHPVSDKILHVDFYQLSDNKEVNMEIPVIIKGSAPGVMLEGGTLVINKRKLKVRALPKNLPDLINVDISTLKLGNKISIVDLESENFTFLHPDNTVVCKVRTSRVSMSIEEEALEGEASEEGAEATAEGESSSGEE